MISSKPKEKKSILLIDDDKLVLNSLAKLLKTFGYTLQLAQSGEEALKKVKDTKFDLIIADIRMPKIDGIETLKKIREIYHKNNRPKIREIIITGYADTQAQSEAEKLGITDYIYKPFSTVDFIKTVKKRLRIKEER